MLSRPFVVSGKGVARAVQLVSVPRHVPHVEYRLRPGAPSVPHRPLVRHHQYAKWGYLLRPVHWPRHEYDTAVRQFQEAIRREGQLADICKA